MVGVSFAVNCFAVAGKVALLDPAGTLTEAGTVRFAELDDRLTVAPADVLTVTVHVLDPPGDKLAGVQLTALTAGADRGTLTVPPALVIVIPLPAADAPRGLMTLIVAAVLPASVTVTVATTPSPIVVAFIPHAMHMYPLAPVAQVRLFPAAESAGPAATVRLETADAEYVRVHCSAAGGLDALEESERLRVTGDPGAAVPDERFKAGCAHKALLDGNRSAGKIIRPRKRTLFSMGTDLCTNEYKVPVL